MAYCTNTRFDFVDCTSALFFVSWEMWVQLCILQETLSVSFSFQCSMFQNKKPRKSTAQMLWWEVHRCWKRVTQPYPSQLTFREAHLNGCESKARNWPEIVGDNAKVKDRNIWSIQEEMLLISNLNSNIYFLKCNQNNVGHFIAIKFQADNTQFQLGYTEIGSFAHCL